MKNLRDKLKELNKQCAITKRLESGTDKCCKSEDKELKIVVKILKELGLEEGYSIEDAHKAEQVFLDNGLTINNAYMLGDGSWS